MMKKFVTKNNIAALSASTQIASRSFASSKFVGYEKVTHELNLDAALFAPFSLGDVKRVASTPDNKAPSSEDTIEGRYAGVLFTTASQKGALYEVYEDMKYLSGLYTHSESFRMFTENAGVGEREIKLLNQALLETAPFHATTTHFLTVLA